MNREDIIRMAQEAQMPFYWRTGEITYLDKLERFAALVASAERERIKQANAPEIERINAYIKEALAQPEQEPVVCVEYIPCCTDQTCPKCKAAIKPELVCVCGAVWEGQELIYTTPQRTQPEQEPVAWIYKGGKSFDGNKYSDEYELTASKQVALWKDKNAKPLYTTPPQRKPLTDEDISEIVRGTHNTGSFARAIEAKLRSKNNG